MVQAKLRNRRCPDDRSARACIVGPRGLLRATANRVAAPAWTAVHKLEPGLLGESKAETGYDRGRSRDPVSPPIGGYVTTMGDGFSRGPVLGRSVTLFSFWVHELERIMQKWDATHGNLPYRLPLADSTGLECWQEAFDDGMSPQEAFDEDRHCWK